MFLVHREESVATDVTGCASTMQSVHVFNKGHKHVSSHEDLGRHAGCCYTQVVDKSREFRVRYAIRALDNPPISDNTRHPKIVECGYA